MSAANVTFSAFTKPWQTPLPILGAFIKKLGFDGIELPVRPGYQVPPEKVTTDLRAAGQILADCGLAITSIAGPTDEPTIAACAEANIPIIRICLDIPAHVSYLDHEANLRRQFYSLLPLLERYDLTLGIQNHQ